MSKKNNNSNKRLRQLSQKASAAPALSQIQAPREKWRDQAPRLPEEHKARLQEVVREIYYKRQFSPDRNNFLNIHSMIEDEISNVTREEFGLIAGVEWNGKFSDDNAKVMQKIGGKDHIEGVLPTQEFLDSELFDYIEVFHPVVVLFTFDDYDMYMRNAEQSIQEAESRRESGDAYMTDRDRDISHRPEADSG